MINDIAAKLRLTAFALGCASRKELCARFRAVNSATQCDLDRLNKWMQGRALPRSPLLYTDWIRVIGTSRDAAWLTSCGITAFAAELQALTGVPSETLLGTAGARRGRRAPEPPAPLRSLVGQFACYSHAWSPYFRGRLLRSSMIIRFAGDRMEADYHEKFNLGRLHLSGRVEPTGRGALLLLADRAGGTVLSFYLIVPGPPAGVLCGLYSGMALLSQDVRPTAARILLVRVPEAAALAESEGYLDTGEDAVSSDVAALGARLHDPAALDALVAAFLQDDMVTVEQAQQRALADLLDPPLLSQHAHV